METGGSWVSTDLLLGHPWYIKEGKGKEQGSKWKQGLWIFAAGNIINGKYWKQWDACYVLLMDSNDPNACFKIRKWSCIADIFKTMCLPWLCRTYATRVVGTILTTKVCSGFLFTTVLSVCTSRFEYFLRLMILLWNWVEIFLILRCLDPIWEMLLSVKDVGPFFFLLYLHLPRGNTKQTFRCSCPEGRMYCCRQCALTLT